MKCPFGYEDHPVTWRCYAVYAVDWLSGRWPESWPFWTYRPLIWLVVKFESESTAPAPQEQP